jgi:hypothetical protein
MLACIWEDQLVLNETKLAENSQDPHSTVKEQGMSGNVQKKKKSSCASSPNFSTRENSES